MEAALIAIEKDRGRGCYGAGWQLGEEKGRQSGTERKEGRMKRAWFSLWRRGAGSAWVVVVVPKGFEVLLRGERRRLAVIGGLSAWSAPELKCAIDLHECGL